MQYLGVEWFCLLYNVFQAVLGCWMVMFVVQCVSFSTWVLDGSVCCTLWSMLYLGVGWFCLLYNVFHAILDCLVVLFMVQGVQAVLWCYFRMPLIT